MGAEISYVSVTIADGGTTSDVADVSNGRSIVGIIVSASFTGTALTFTVCDTSGGTYVSMRTATGSGAYSLVVGASQYLPLPAADFAGIRYLKVVSGSAESGAKIIKLVTRTI